MVKRLISIIAAFVSANVVAGLVANFILQPLFSSSFGSHIRNPQDGLHMPSLLMGYLLLVFLIDFALRRTQFPVADDRRLLRGALAGLYVGLGVFAAGHLITAGWSKLDPSAMFFSSLFDTSAAIIAGMVMSLINSPKRENA